MDIFMPIALCVIFIIFFTICGWCCKRKREGTVFGYGPTVSVTQAHHAPSPQVVPPYPIDPRHPTPATNAPGPGFAAHQPPYPTHTPNMPFPQAPLSYGLPPPAMGLPYAAPFVHGYHWQGSYSSPTYPLMSTPMASYIPMYHMPTPSIHNGQSPYPPAGHTQYPPAGYAPAAHDYGANPPPYDVAVSQPPMHPPAPVKDGYVKQSPYNPSYN